MIDVIRSPQASEDIVDIAAHLGLERDELLDRFIDAVEATYGRGPPRPAPPLRLFVIQK